MSIADTAVATLSDTDLLAEVTRLAAGERHATVRLIAALGELDARRLYLGQGFPSTFAYCLAVLRLSEHAAYNRIEAARVVRRFPIVLDRLADGSITLTAVCLLAAHLTPENHREVLDAAQHKSKREVEVLVAQLRPLPPVPSSVRKLPTTAPAPVPDAPASMPAAPPAAAGMTAPLDALVTVSTPAPPVAPAPRPAMVAPLTPDQYKIQVTVSRETVEKLRRVQDLMRHTVPDGDPAVIFDRALTRLLEHLERTKLARTDRPRKSRGPAPRSRHVAADVRRAVWARDGRQCAFVGADGRRCQERGFLELHHTTPYAMGGEATVDTIELRCRAHNAYEAERDFGPSVRERRSTRRNPSAATSP